MEIGTSKIKATLKYIELMTCTYTYLLFRSTPYREIWILEQSVRSAERRQWTSSTGEYWTFCESTKRVSCPFMACDFCKIPWKKVILIKLGTMRSAGLLWPLACTELSHLHSKDAFLTYLVSLDCCEFLCLW